MLSSPGRRLMYRTPSLLNMKIFVSSLQRTFFHSSVVQWICAFAQVRRFFRCFSLRYGLFLGILALSLALTSCRRTVRSETLTLESWRMRLISFAVDFLFFRACLTILLSVFSLVHLFLPLPFAVVSVFVPSNHLHSLHMPDRVAPPPILCAISRRLYPSERSVTAMARFFGVQSSLFTGGIINLCSINNISVRFID